MDPELESAAREIWDSVQKELAKEAEEVGAAKAQDGMYNSDDGFETVSDDDDDDDMSSDGEGQDDV